MQEKCSSQADCAGYFIRMDIRVAPLNPQNMALNSFSIAKRRSGNGESSGHAGRGGGYRASCDHESDLVKTDQ